MRVLNFKGIEGPLHAADVARKSLTSLLQLELCAEAAVAIAVAHRQHVRVEVRLWKSIGRFRAGFHARQRHGEADHRFRAAILRRPVKIGIERAQDLAPDCLRDQKSLSREYV